MKFFTIIILLTFLQFSKVFSQEKTCTSCHKQSQSSCNLSCQDCHSSPNADFIPNEKEHPAIIQNPSLEKWWEEKCMACHKNYIDQFKSGLHYSNANIINQTRYLWGKDTSLQKNNNHDVWKELQNISLASGHSPAALVDNLLAKKCMACHFNAPGKQNAVEKKRNAGCASCHIPLDQKTGKPLFGHAMQKTVKDETCLTCHGNNHVGADYYGFFEHDYHEEYATPYGAEPLFGTFQHRLIKDTHANAGMECSDCHLKSKDERKKVKKCPDCHGGFKKKKDTRNKKHEKRITNNQTPIFMTDEISHKDFHKNVECSACHAQWSFQDYGLHLFLDESDNFQMWETQKWQGDQTIIDLLDSFLEDEHELPLPQSPNRLTGKKSRGVWYKGWTFRRWEDPVLGINEKGRYSIIRPMYQYYISYVDSNENVWLDSAIPKRANAQPGWSWDAYTPHTIVKGRTCESCHENPKAAGIGIRQSKSDNAAHYITIPSAPIEEGARLLNKKEQEQLLLKSKRYKKWRVNEFMKNGVNKLFKTKEF
jgi:Cytochrome c3